MKLKFLRLGLIAVLLMGVFYACQKEFSKPGPAENKAITDPNVPLTVALAREYLTQVNGVNGNIVPLKDASVSEDTRKNRKYVYWKKAYTAQTPQHTYMEAPLLYNRRTTTLIFDQDNKRDPQTERRIAAASFNRVIVYKSKASGAVDRRIVTYMPDIKYLNKHRDISSNRIGKLDKDFSGYLIYKTWDEQLLFAIKIKNSKAVKRLNFRKTKQGSKAGTSTKAWVCDQVTTVIYTELCYEVDPESQPTPPPADPGPAIITEELCAIWESVVISEECVYEDDPDTTDPACFDTGDCSGGDDGGDGSYGGGEPAPPDDDDLLTTCLNLATERWIRDLENMNNLRDAPEMQCYADNLALPAADLLQIFPSLFEAIVEARATQGGSLADIDWEGLASFITDIIETKRNILVCIVAAEMQFSDAFWTRQAQLHAQWDWCYIQYP